MDSRIKMLIEELEDGENKSKYLLEELIKSNHRCLTLQYICDDQAKDIDKLKTDLSIANRRLTDRDRRLEIMNIVLARVSSSLNRIQMVLR